MSIGARSESMELTSTCLATTGASKASTSLDGVTQKTVSSLLLSINNCIIVSMSDGPSEEVAGEVSIGEDLTGIAVRLGTEGRTWMCCEA